MKFDMHIHTKYSMWSFSEIKDIIKYAKKKGLDGIAICDHDTMRGVDEFKKLKTELKLISGIEITSKSGEILAYGINEIIPKGLSAEETIERIHSQGGVAVAPHPFDSMRRNLGKEVFTQNLDGIEVFNSKGNSSKSNKEALIASAQLKLGITAGSDSHSPEFVGKAYTTFEGDFIKALKKRKTSYFGEYISYQEIIKSYLKNIKKLPLILSKT
ncbi:MAG: PHP domain-containing protein [Candidatus Nanoarchaeia archaeon]|nr:PHP domain-containing protein [Candidatus Nanoarchaeia archaeon]